MSGIPQGQAGSVRVCVRIIRNSVLSLQTADHQQVVLPLLRKGRQVLPRGGNIVVDYSQVFAQAAQKQIGLRLARVLAALGRIRPVGQLGMDAAGFNYGAEEGVVEPVSPGAFGAVFEFFAAALARRCVASTTAP